MHRVDRHYEDSDYDGEDDEEEEDEDDDLYAYQNNKSSKPTTRAY